MPPIRVGVELYPTSCRGKSLNVKVVVAITQHLKFQRKITLSVGAVSRMARKWKLMNCSLRV